MAEYCNNERHDKPCPLPCQACEEECNSNDLLTLKEAMDDAITAYIAAATGTDALEYLA